MHGHLQEINIENWPPHRSGGPLSVEIGQKTMVSKVPFR